MGIKNWLQHLFKKTSKVRNDLGETFYDINEKILLEQIERLEKEKIELQKRGISGGGFVILENSFGDWIQLICQCVSRGKGDFYLERPGNEQEIKQIKKSNISNVTEGFMYYYNKNLNKPQLMKICLSFLKGKLIINKNEWQIAKEGYLNSKGILLVQDRSPGHGEMIVSKK